MDFPGLLMSSYISFSTVLCFYMDILLVTHVTNIAMQLVQCIFVHPAELCDTPTTDATYTPYGEISLSVPHVIHSNQWALAFPSWKVVVVLSATLTKATVWLVAGRTTHDGWFEKNFRPRSRAVGRKSSCVGLSVGHIEVSITPQARWEPSSVEFLHLFREVSKFIRANVTALGISPDSE